MPRAIATIAMAADEDVYGVTLGAMIGHFLCTGLAVIGGRILASKISERTVVIVGGALFLLFSVLLAIEHWRVVLSLLNLDTAALLGSG